MTAKRNTVAKGNTTTDKAVATFTAEQRAALESIKQAGIGFTKAHAAITRANEAKGAALPALIAGLTFPGIMAMQLTIVERSKSTTAESVVSLAAYAKGFGKSKTKETAFKQAVLANLFGLNDVKSKSAASVWTGFTMAYRAAHAVMSEGLAATYEGGKLAVTGQPKTDKGKTLANAKSAKELVGLSPSLRAKGTNKPPAGKTGAAGKTTSLAQQAADLVKALRAMAGKETVAGKTAANLKTLVSLIAKVAPAE